MPKLLPVGAAACYIPSAYETRGPSDLVFLHLDARGPSDLVFLHLDAPQPSRSGLTPTTVERAAVLISST